MRVSESRDGFDDGMPGVADFCFGKVQHEDEDKFCIFSADGVREGDE